MLNEVHASELKADRWPTYRPRRAVVARRLDGPTWLDGRFYRDGYLVRDASGRFTVVHVAEFEAIYELGTAYE